MLKPSERQRPSAGTPRGSVPAPRQRPRAGVKPFFRAALTPAGEFEILIYEEIGEYFDWDTYSMAGVTAKSVRQSLDSAGAFSKIKVRINSPGGDCFEGIAIGNVLKSLGKPIEVHIDGIAASAASIIAMCGQPVIMASNAMMMIHKAWSICVGNTDDMVKMAGTLNAIDSGSIAQTYVDRTGKTMDEILAMMAAETWLSARDCVEGGFATMIASGPNETAIAMARDFKILSRMKAVPDTLRSKAKKNGDQCACECAACVDGDCANCNNAECADPNCVDCPMQAGADNSARDRAAILLAESGAITSLKRARLDLNARRRAT